MVLRVRNVRNAACLHDKQKSCVTEHCIDKQLQALAEAAVALAAVAVGIHTSNI